MNEPHLDNLPSSGATGAIESREDDFYVWEIEEPAIRRGDPANDLDRRKPSDAVALPVSSQTNEPPRLTTRQLALFTRQLAALLQAGMPLVPALAALAEQGQTPTIKAMLERLQQQVNAGEDFAGALGHYKTVFSPLYTGMVQAGQAGGSLDRALLKLADILDKRARLQSTLRASIAYPAFMAVMAVGVVIFLLTAVVPQITTIFIEMNRDLPLITRILIAASSFMQQSWPILLVVALSGGVAGYLWLRSESNRHILDRVWLRLPGIGSLITQIETSRFARTYAMLLSSGLPAVQALELARPVIQNRAMNEPLKLAGGDIERGSSIAEAIRQTGVFPGLLIHTIETGEQTGILRRP